LDFKFCRVQILEGDLKAKFSTSLVVEAQEDARQWPTREASSNPLPTLAQAMNAADSCEKTDSSEHSEQVPQRLFETWKNPNISRAMTELIKKPDSPRTEAVRQRTLQLGIMSLDLNSCHHKKAPTKVEREGQQQ
ncbi:hypothetical protein FOZ62_021154, partial [Perkinsus olseni]